MTTSLKPPAAHGYPVVRPKCGWCRSMPCVCVRERPCVCGGTVVVVNDMAAAVVRHQRSRKHAAWRERNGL